MVSRYFVQVSNLASSNPIVTYLDVGVTMFNMIHEHDIGFLG